MASEAFSILVRLLNGDIYSIALNPHPDMTHGMICDAAYAQFPDIFPYRYCQFFRSHKEDLRDWSNLEDKEVVGCVIGNRVLEVVQNGIIFGDSPIYPFYYMVFSLSLSLDTEESTGNEYHPISIPKEEDEVLLIVYIQTRQIVHMEDDRVTHHTKKNYFTHLVRASTEELSNFRWEEGKKSIFRTDTLRNSLVQYMRVRQGDEGYPNPGRDTLFDRMCRLKHHVAAAVEIAMGQ
jgi:hypothetical protein